MSKEQDIVEGNKLIAEFMDGKIYDGIEISVKFYHSSWDWLMPVVEKIIAIEEVFKFDIDFSTSQTEVTIMMKVAHVNRIIVVDYKGIDAVYEAVIQFIQWYNSIQQKQVKE